MTWPEFVNGTIMLGSGLYLGIGWALDRWWF